MSGVNIPFWVSDNVNQTSLKKLTATTTFLNKVKFFKNLKTELFNFLSKSSVQKSISLQELYQGNQDVSFSFSAPHFILCIEKLNTFFDGKQICPDLPLCIGSYLGK